MTAFREDEFVRVSDNAPSDFFPGKTGVIVSIAKCASPITERTTGTKIGDLVIWVGIDLGETVEAVVVPEKWLESTSH
ncbi:MAG: hypothetical protein AAF986_10465 [Pseudomonadota bacterium]